MRSLPLLSLLLLLPLVHAQSTWGDDAHSLGAPTVDGFTLDGATLTGEHVTATTTDDGLGAVTLGGAPYLDGLSWRPLDWSVDGPLALAGDADGAASLHDVPLGWLTVRGGPGTVTLAGTTDWSLDGATATAGAATVFLERPGFMEADGTTLTATFAGDVGLAVSAEPGIFGRAPSPGAWARVVLDGDDATANWLRVHGAPFALTGAQPDGLGVDLVGTLGDGAPDLLVRLDVDGLAGDRFVLRMADLASQPVALEDLLDDERGPLSHNVSADGDRRTVWLRLPAGQSGHLTLRADDEPPTIDVRLVDVEETWAPRERVPTLVATLDGPGLATLVVGDDYEKRTLRPATEHRFRLVGLQPETEYAYAVTATDLAGNTNTTHGAFRTGVATSASRTIEARSEALPDGSWRLVANVTDESGLPVASGVMAFVDKQPASPTFDGTHWILEIRPGAGEHEVAWEATGPDGRVREVATFGEPAAAGADSPLPLLALPALLLAALRRR